MIIQNTQLCSLATQTYCPKVFSWPATFRCRSAPKHLLSMSHSAAEACHLKLLVVLPEHLCFVAGAPTLPNEATSIRAFSFHQIQPNMKQTVMHGVSDTILSCYYINSAETGDALTQSSSHHTSSIIKPVLYVCTSFLLLTQQLWGHLMSQPLQGAITNRRSAFGTSPVYGQYLMAVFVSLY